MNRLHGLEAAAIPHLMSAAEALEYGRADEAEKQLAHAAAHQPNHPEVQRLRAGILGLRGQPVQAIDIMRQALAQRPQDALYHNTLGTLLGNAGMYDAAVQSLLQSCRLQPSLDIAWFNLGIMLTKSVRNDEAIEAFRRVVALQPRHVPARAMLADMLRTQGKTAEATTEYRALLAIQPASGAAWWGLADIKNQRFDENDIAQMRAALQRADTSENDRNAIGFALARALDDQGLYADALAALEQAHAIGRRQYPWDAAAFSANVRAGVQAFASSATSEGDTQRGHEVIFVVSPPRSGSTLVEQILASHPQVEGAGELPDLPGLLFEESRRRGKHVPQWANEATPADWQRLGEAYLERTARWRTQRERFIDKLPSNWMLIGAIRAMLPGARVVVVRRDPLETCFACYRQRLDHLNGYARSFDDLAAFWRDFDYSARHWGERYPTHVREQNYEALASDTETQIRALLEFVGLPFDEACLRFHENTREVRSPSATQVREPMRQDTARTDNYGSLLDPLRLALDLPAWRGA
ncbi:tetratricopeptide repeat-containing sulfotransferase family protein [Dyella sp. C11]|uniref:tetratricopeptide repeat-containing sulfotransferase family protein n=1 Tax=Dyella sp. C11 TaxID=2126991 RepID=UPI001E55015D|nr:tetratricopeptide repeat-containing sulfotransferase family protein [Dyella sp. C11]